MSAWVVSKEHIDLLVTAGLDLPNRNCVGSTLTWWLGDAQEELTDLNADMIGGKLWAENYASVEGRYPHRAATDDLPGPSDFEGTDTLTYQLTRTPGELDPVVVIKAIKCYCYQSDAHSGWEASEAKVVVENLMAECISLLPGYAKAPWGFDDANYFLANAPVPPRSPRVLEVPRSRPATMSDEAALDEIAVFMGSQRSWSGYDVCDYVARVLLSTGRPSVGDQSKDDYNMYRRQARRAGMI